MTETWHEIKKRHEKEKIDLLLKHGDMSQAQAAALLGMDQNTLSVYLSARGISWPRKTNHRLTVEQYKERKTLAEMGFPIGYIAKKLNMRKNSLYQWYVNNNITFQG